MHMTNAPTNRNLHDELADLAEAHEVTKRTIRNIRTAAAHDAAAKLGIRMTKCPTPYKYG